jgi:hypothetical protein
MRLPRIVTHVLDSESKTATLGYMVFLTATTGLFYGHIISADTWLICVAISSTLIGGKLVGETVLAMKMGRPTASEKEVKADAPVPPAA